MSEEIKNANQAAELNEEQLEDVSGGGCGDMHHDYDKKGKGYDKYKGDWKGGDKYKGDWKGDKYKNY